MRIGVIDRSVPGWEGGGNYSRVTLASLALVAKDQELHLISGATEAPPPAKLLALAPVDPLPGEPWLLRRLGLPSRPVALPGEARVRNLMGLTNRADPFDVARRAGLDVVLPTAYVPLRQGRLRSVGWIPDFQHVHLPHFFQPGELALRDRFLLELAARSTRLMVSSEAALTDLKAFAPAYAAKARVVRFGSLFALEPPAGDPARTLRRYHLPEKFALVVNQFWAHKNHAVVVEALGLLRKGGLRIPLVMVGLPADGRDPQNATLSRLLQQIAAADLGGQAVPLGRVTREELTDLLRAAAVVLQPSRFEGWNTTVEDAKALGRPLLCSDLPVHREQAPHALGYFGCDDAGALAALLSREWERLSPGPSMDEAAALAEGLAAVRVQGEALLESCREAVGE